MLIDSLVMFAKKNLNISLIVKNFFIPFFILALYCGFFGFISYWMNQKDGVNYVFIGRLWNYLLISLGLMILIILLMYKLRKFDELNFKNLSSEDDVSLIDSIIVLMPLTPVIQYIIINWSILSVFDAVLVLAFFGLLAIICVFAVPALFGFIYPTRRLMALGLAFITTLTNMASLSQYFSWYMVGSLKIQLLYFMAMLTAGWVLLGIKNKKVLFTFVIAYFFINTVIQLPTSSIKAQIDQKSSGWNLSTSQNEFDGIQRMVNSRKPLKTPNIYLLVYDSYVCNETMLAYGIDNSRQEQYLVDLGFTLYPDTYSIGAETNTSMSRVFNASTEYYGDARRGISGAGRVQNALRSVGYKTYGIFPFDYEFRGIGSSYDVSFPEVEVVLPPYDLMISAIARGEFRFDQGFEKQTYQQYLEVKKRHIEEISGDSILFYSHTYIPGHSQNSGVCLPNETTLYSERVLVANSEMRQDVDLIIKRDPGAIIIVAGDHGPYLTKNCYITSPQYSDSEISRLDVQDRFGTFLAIRWPSRDYEIYDDIVVLQDLFPVIFSYIFDDLAFQNLKVTPVTLDASTTSGVYVNNSIIHGGLNDGEPLFLSGQSR